MKFNHLIQINDPTNPLVDPLTREQLWRGLVMRAEAPQLFMPHLENCLLSDKTPDSVSRVLDYGTLQIRDTVTYLPQISVHYHVPAQGEIATTSNMSMTIEEPQEELLFVRFEYDDGMPEQTDSETEFYNQFRRSAYQEADIDTIRMIRQLLEQGSLN